MLMTTSKTSNDKIENDMPDYLNNISNSALRWVVLVLLVLSAVFAYLWLTHPFDPTITASEYPYIDFSRNFISQEHYITNVQPLRDTLKEKARQFEQGGRKVSIYVEFLNTGANISVNQETYILPASLIKVPLAIAVLKKVQDGEWELENELALLNGDKDDTSGNERDMFADYPIGATFTIEHLLERLLIDSDNTAYNILLRNTGEKQFEEVVNALGLQDLFRVNGAVSAKEYSRILRSLYTASYLNRANSERILEWLDKATFSDFISHTIEDEIPFPHKYGLDREKFIFGDSGIAYIPNRPYIISVLVEGKAGGTFEEEYQIASAFIQDVSMTTYTFFKSDN